MAPITERKGVLTSTCEVELAAALDPVCRSMCSSMALLVAQVLPEAMQAMPDIA